METFTQKLLPVGSIVILNPMEVRKKELQFAMLSKNASQIVPFEYSHSTAYSDVDLYCTIITYEEDQNDPLYHYITLMPEKKPDSLLFIKLPKNYRGELSFLRLLELT